MPTIVSAHLSDELAEALDGWARALGATRSPVIRALIEDAIDHGEMRVRPPIEEGD